jgi:hypothetical protein
MTAQAHARRIVAALEQDVREDIAADPRSAIEVHFQLTVMAATSFAERGAGGWCDGMSETKSGIILYRTTAGRRENFTLAHELAHHLIDEDDDCPSWLGDQPEPLRQLEEVCDQIAAHLLISTDAMSNALNAAPPSAETITALYSTTVASRTACVIAVANRLPCEGFVCIVDPEDPGRVFAGARAGGTRPYAWKGDAIPDAHPLNRLPPPAATRAWWENWRGERREFYMTTAAVDGYTCAVFTETDFWDIEKFHGYEPVEVDRGNDALITCLSCGYNGKTRWWPCPQCNVPNCPKCGECDCGRRERSVKRGQCQRCFAVVRVHLLIGGLCDGCR